MGFSYGTIRSTRCGASRRGAWTSSGRPVHRQDPEVRLPDSDVRDIGRWPGNNPVLVSNLAVIAVSGSVSADLVRNIIFDELLRFDRLAPISVNQIHGHSVVNLIVQQGIAPVINHERRVSEVDQ